MVPKVVSRSPTQGAETLRPRVLSVEKLYTLLYNGLAAHPQPAGPMVQPNYLNSPTQRILLKDFHKTMLLVH